MNSMTCARNAVALEVEDRTVSSCKSMLQCRQWRSAEALFLADPLVDEDVRVHRHTERQQDARHAGQGQSGLEQRHYTEHQHQVHHQANIREPAEKAIEDRHEDDHQHEADRERDRPRPDRIGPQFRADAALLHHRQRRRQRASPQQHREVIGRSGGEAAADLTAPAGDRLADDRRADRLAVQHDGEAVVDVGPRHVGKAPRTDGIEREVDHPFAGLRVVARLGVGQIRAVHVDAAAHGDLLAWVVLHRQEINARWRRRTGGRIGGLVDQLERHVRGLAEQFLDAVGIADARQLHDDAAVALLGDLGVDHAGLVDAAADDLNRLLHRTQRPRVQRNGRKRQRDRAVRGRG